MSFPLSDGRVIWLFGDSHVNSFDQKTKTLPCLFQARNAGLVQKKNDLKHPVTLVGEGPGFRSFFRRVQENDPWFWPLWGFEHDGSAYVYLSELHQVGTGNFSFSGTGHDYLARLSLPDLHVNEYLPLPDFEGKGFGCGFVKHSDGYVYTYGMRGTREGNALRVARFKPETPDKDWTYWDGTNWTSTVTNAAALLRSYAVSMSVSKVRNKFLLIATALSVKCDMGREIYMATSDRPEGPFTKLKPIYTIDDTLDGHYPFFYLPAAHPEFINRRDELLVTYSINGYEPCAPACVNGRMNPDHYRPRAIRVPLKLIDPTFN